MMENLIEEKERKKEWTTPVLFSLLLKNTKSGNENITPEELESGQPASI